jgi:hypothetical protein
MAKSEGKSSGDIRMLLGREAIPGLLSYSGNLKYFDYFIFLFFWSEHCNPSETCEGQYTHGKYFQDFKTTCSSLLQTEDSCNKG